MFHGNDRFRAKIRRHDMGPNRDIKPSHKLLLIASWIFIVFKGYHIITKRNGIPRHIETTSIFLKK